MTEKVLLAQLAATRAQSLALAASITALMAAWADTVADADADAAPVSPVPDVSAQCAHPVPMRESAARMGYPTAFYCRNCNTEVLTP